MEKEQCKIQIIFSELKSKGLLPPNRKLRQSKLTPNFRSAIIFSNTINYNPKFCKMQDENIVFSLLHEEGHKIKSQYAPSSLLFLSILEAIPFILMLIFFNNNPILVFSSLAYTVIFVLMTIALLRQSFHEDEFDSDRFAAEALRDAYGIKKPSYVAYNTLIEIYSIMQPPYSKKISIFDKVEISLLDIHPSIDERVKNIARYVDRY